MRQRRYVVYLSTYSSMQSKSSTFVSAALHHLRKYFAKKSHQNYYTAAPRDLFICIMSQLKLKPEPEADSQPNSAN